MKRTSILLLLIVFLLSCRKEVCNLDQVEFADLSRTPFQINHKTIDQSNCEVQVEFRFPDNYFFSEAKMFLRDSSYYIKLDDEEILLFNLNTREKTNYLVQLRQDQFDFQLDSVHNFEGIDVFKYRLLKASRFEGKYFDIVCFVTLNQFVIGSYISTFDEDGVEVVIAEDGEILISLIDYSKKRFRKFL